MRFDPLLSLGAVDAFGREKPADVGRIVGLHLPQVAATMATKGEHEVLPVFSYLAHAVHGWQIFQPSSQICCIFCVVSGDDPSLEFRD